MVNGCDSGQPGPDADDYIRDPAYRAGAYLKKIVSAKTGPLNLKFNRFSRFGSRCDLDSMILI